MHSDVTQCSNCLLFLYVTKNCHMAYRCIKCGQTHAPDACQLMETADPVCANCGAAHKASSRTCLKRAEFIEIRKRASTNNQPGRRKVPPNNTKEFPAIGSRHPIPLLAPLPLNPTTKPVTAASTYAEATKSGSRSPPPGLQGNSSAMTFSQSATGTTENEPMLIMEQNVSLVVECINTFRNCKSRAEQLQSAVMIASKYGP